jgi:hypothetical protein
LIGCQQATPARQKRVVPASSGYLAPTNNMVSWGWAGQHLITGSGKRGIFWLFEDQAEVVQAQTVISSK